MTIVWTIFYSESFSNYGDDGCIVNPCGHCISTPMTLHMTDESNGAKWREVIAEAADRGLADVRAHKQLRSRSRRASIVEAAVVVFSREGIARARIGDIATAAGVPLSSVYDYFADKEAVAYALPFAHITRFFEEFVPKANEQQTAHARLRLFMTLTIEYAAQNKDWARTLYLEIWPSVMVEKALVRVSLDDYARIMLELIRDGERNQEWPEDPAPYQTVTIFIGSVNQFISTWLLYGEPQDLPTATTGLVNRLMSMLTPAAGPPLAAPARKPTRSASSAQRASARK
jgi:AcrR family transcriptional regulator